MQPRHLNPEERQDPKRVIDNFFDYAHLPQARGLFRDLMRCTVTGNYNSALSEEERTNLFDFLERLEKLIEAAHLIHRSIPDV